MQRCLQSLFLRHWKYFFCFLLLQCVIIYLSISVSIKVTRDEKTHNFVHRYSSRKLEQKSRRVILAWTSFWFQDYWCDMTENSTEVSQCSDRCEVTTDKNRLHDSDAIVFHLPDILPWTSLPKTRRLDQVWVLYNLEPPPRQIWYMGGVMWRNVFNWTMSYRQDSTVFVRPYHGYEPLTAAQKQKSSHSYVNFLANKTKFAIATISDCYDDAGRYKDIYELQKYIDVDIYGYCGSEVCHQWRDDCEKTIREYKFQLAFENAYCQDYITEKYWEAHMRKLIPVVNWKTDPTNLVFPNSYINIFDFPNIKSAAEHMIKVSENEKLYNSYFEWTKRYKMNCHCGCHWCALCDKLHDSNIPSQVIVDPMGWASEDTCQMFSVGIKLTDTSGILARIPQIIIIMIR